MSDEAYTALRKFLQFDDPLQKRHKKTQLVPAELLDAMRDQLKGYVRKHPTFQPGPARKYITADEIFYALHVMEVFTSEHGEQVRMAHWHMAAIAGVPGTSAVNVNGQNTR